MNRTVLPAAIVGIALAGPHAAALEIGTRDVAVVRIGVVDMDRVMERAPAVRGLQDECRALEQQKRTALDAMREEVQRLAVQRISVQATIEGYQEILSSAVAPSASEYRPIAPPAGGVAHSSAVALPPPRQPSVAVSAPSRDGSRAELEERLVRTRSMIAELDKAIADRALQQASSRGRSDAIKIQQEVQEYQRRKTDAEREVADLEGRLAVTASSPTAEHASSENAVAAKPAPPSLAPEEIRTRIAAAQQELADLSARIAAVSRDIADREASIAGEIAEFRQRRECEILSELYDAVKAVAARERLNVVIEKSGILYGVPEVDITDQVIRRIVK